ncbi:helix-turn-helix domain-containing protein [Pseudovibrio sp. POLY-S9]|uniref:helix-turn-helix domain-containing protein n=1 Tax=Pseudovibrio sp. POLY-S9 TaxID=1576596 RepID=UPI000709ACD3|nr:helix-turn-helix domain-containing protein [Pseudovibrio sp. POLY-S9]
MARSIHSLDSAREAANITQKQLVAAAGLDPSTYRRFLRGDRTPQQSTLKRLDYALQNIRRTGQCVQFQTAHLVFRLCVATLCVKANLDPEAVLSHKPSDRRTADPDWAAAAEVRRRALYLANTACGVSQADLARVANLTRAAVSLALNAMEDNRDDPEVEQLFSLVEGAVQG